MKQQLLVCVAFIGSGIVGGCDQKPSTVTPSQDTPVHQPESQSSSQPNPRPGSTDADNTARNKRDTDPSQKSPLDQSNSAGSIKITAEIRRAILDDKSMSTNAQNCKVITDSAGAVTLRGPVASQAEKDAIESKAKAVAGVTSVVNELEVKQK